MIFGKYSSFLLKKFLSFISESETDRLFHADAVLIRCDTVAFIKFLVFPMRP